MNRSGISSYGWAEATQEARDRFDRGLCRSCDNPHRHGWWECDGCYYERIQGSFA